MDQSMSMTERIAKDILKIINTINDADEIKKYD